MTERLEIDDAVGHRRLNVTRGEHRHRHGNKFLPRRIKLSRQFRSRTTNVVRGRHRRCNEGAERSQTGTTPLSDLAPQQIQTLDAVRAFMDRVEAVIAVMLLDIVFPGIAISPEHLDRQTVGLKAPLRRPTFGDRRQDVQQQTHLIAFAFGFGTVLPVDEPGAVQRQRQSTFDIGLLRQQHSFDVGVFDDRHLRRRRILTRDRTALGALARVLERFEIPGVPQRHRAHPDTEARLIHHVEHVDDAAMLFTDQITGRAVEVQHRVGDTALSHLVVEAGDRDLVARTDRSVRIDKEFRHDEQRDALGPGRPTGDFGEHQMHDVLRHLVFGTRDPHLGSE